MSAQPAFFVAESAAMTTQDASFSWLGYTMPPLRGGNLAVRSQASLGASVDQRPPRIVLAAC